MSDGSTGPPANGENGFSHDDEGIDQMTDLPTAPPPTELVMEDDESEINMLSRKEQLIQQMKEEEKYKEERRRELLYKLKHGIEDSDDDDGDGDDRPTSESAANLARFRLSLDSVTVDDQFDRNFHVDVEDDDDVEHSHAGGNAGGDMDVVEEEKEESVPSQDRDQMNVLQSHSTVVVDVDDLVSEDSNDDDAADVDFGSNDHGGTGVSIGVTESDDMVSVKQKESNDYPSEGMEGDEEVKAEDGGPVEGVPDLEEVMTDTTTTPTGVTGLEEVVQSFDNDVDRKGNMDDDEESVFYRFLKTGFDYVKKELKPKSPKKNRDASGTDTAPTTTKYLDGMVRMPVVNFIDPTTPNIGTISPKSSKDVDDGDDPNSPSRHMKRRAWNNKKKHKLRELNIYNKFETVFHEQHKSILRKVSYRNLRSNEIEVIEDLPLRTQLTAPIILDPAEWHNSPICHVYIAACCSLDHYRSKVRPSLRAFVNQIDGAGSGNEAEAISAAKKAATKEYGAKKRSENKREQVAHANEAVKVAKNAAGGNASSKYLIIFVPIHMSSIDMDAPSQIDDAYKGGGLGLRGRIAAAAALRRSTSQATDRQSTGDSNMEDDESTIGKDMNGTALSAATPAQIHMLSKEHKEVHRRFINDFPNGRTCVLSSLLDANNNLAPDSPIQRQDFNTVLQEMGKTVLSGFVDRIYHYNEELKRCENGTDDVLGTPMKKRMSSEDIDWKQYFLIKESIALTFQQMNLPREALREYEELESKLPVGSMIEMDRAYNSGPILAMAERGDTELFRKAVRSFQSMGDPQHPLLGKYAFSRQIHILFSLKFPRAALVRGLSYVKKVHKIYSEQAKSLSYGESKIALFRNEVCAAGACWDLKRASEVFYFHLLDSDKTNGETAKTKVVLPDGNEKAFISRICDVLNFSRMRCIKISEMAFSSDASIRKALAECPFDAQNEWAPWGESSKVVVQRKSSEPLISIGSVGDCTRWMKSGLASDHHFETMYVELCDEFVQINKILHRNRFAARILAELAEIYITRGDIESAVRNLLICIDNCSLDPWDSLLSWRVFRLACCQRRLSNAPEYLKTLTYCLGTRLAKAMPIKLRHCLQKDLESIVDADEVSGFKWSLSPLFGMKVMIQETTGGTNVQPLIKSSVLMHACEIGDKVQSEVVLKSNLTEPIQVESIKILLQNIDDYQRFAEASDEVMKTDAEIVLSTEHSMSVGPGDNVFKFPWRAMNAGQYVISSVHIQWNKALFRQDYTISTDEAIGFDVLPNEPTQSIELNPIFLIPGHVQDVRLHFYSGADCVNGGRVKLVCSQGLQVKPPSMGEAKQGDRDWLDSCEFDFSSCFPNTGITKIFTVKSEAIDSYDPKATDQVDEDYSYSALQTLEARVTTSYHHGAYKADIQNGTPIKNAPITAILEASVTTLELAALTIKKSGVDFLGDGNFIVSATVVCNTPVPFRLKEWEISLPPTLYLDEEGDLNEGLFDSSVIEGEALYFGFRCKGSANTVEANDASTVLSIVLEDQFGKSFRQFLPLDIREIDEVLKCSESGAENASVANAELKANLQEGLIGSPVMFTYNVDCSSLRPHSSQSGILFHISCVNEDWIIGGSVRGALVLGQSKSCSLSFVGIPIKSGIIKSFPRIELAALHEHEDSSAGALPSAIKVLHKHPSRFLSMAFTSVDEMTCASNLVEI